MVAGLEHFPASTEANSSWSDLSTESAQTNRSSRPLDPNCRVTQYQCIACYAAGRVITQ